MRRRDFPSVAHKLGVAVLACAARPTLAVGDAVPEGTRRLVESPLSTASLIETGMGLAVVLGVMLAIAWLVKRFVQVPGMSKGRVQVLGGVSLGAREKAVLLSVEGRRLLVGVAPGRVQTLIELGETAPVDGEFADQLASVRHDALEPQR